MRKRSTGARFNLGEPWDGKLADFCTAHFSGSATEIVQAALDVFIPAELERDKATAERYEKLQAERQSKPGD
ncbi:MAG: hypothetical protein ABSD08_14465 [Xanthobacteraceae bacterium]|jgi:hypothetical protein